MLVCHSNICVGDCLICVHITDVSVDHNPVETWLDVIEDCHDTSTSEMDVSVEAMRKPDEPNEERTTSATLHHNTLDQSPELSDVPTGSERDIRMRWTAMDTKKSTHVSRPGSTLQALARDYLQRKQC